MIAQMFMDGDFKYLMFIDSDISFDPAFINKLREYNKPIIGGVYLKKKLPYEPVYNRDLAFDPQSGLSIMREIGTGFMMIRRDVFAAIRAMNPEHDYKPDDDQPQASKNYHDWFRVGVKNGRYLSEDYFFCQNALDLGIPTFLDKSMLVVHHGQMQFPSADETIIKGASNLLKNYRLDCDINPVLLTEMHEAVQHQANHRNIDLMPVKPEISSGSEVINPEVSNETN